MNKKKIIWLVVFMGCILMAFSPANDDTIKDFLGIGRNINFNGEQYNLKWSSNPSVNYSKQEYLRKEDNLNKYEKMLIVEAVKGEVTIDQAVSIKIKEFENWNKKNPAINYRRFDNVKTKETIIDYVISDGKGICEWNVYRYQQQENMDDKYMVLYAYSYRNYANQGLKTI